MSVNIENPKYKFVIEMTAEQANESMYYLGKAGIPFNPMEQQIYYSDYKEDIKYGSEIPYLHSCIGEWIVDKCDKSLLKNYRDWGHIERFDFLKMAVEEFDWIDNGIEQLINSEEHIITKYNHLFKEK